MPEDQRRGDPEGRLLASRRAAMLAEAGRVAHVLNALVRRAGVSNDVPIASVVERLAKLEADSLMRAHGRIEGRQRFKRSAGKGAPAHEERLLARLFADESGSAFVAKDESEGWFALGAVAMTADEEQDYCARADDLKRQFFADPDNITLHEPPMRHRDEPFRFEDDPDRQQAFDEAVDALVADSRFVAFAVGVRKAAFARDSRAVGADPYLPTDVYSLSLQLLLERFVDYLANHKSYLLGSLVLEAQGPRENAQHQLAVAETLVHGTQWVSESAFRRYIEPGVAFVPKRGSHPVELSDMLARDVFEWIRSDCKTGPRRWGLWGDKFYRRSDLRMGKFGLKVFPDSDIRDRVEAHRDGFRTGGN